MTPRTKNPPSLGNTELDVASTLINEANALLRQHGEDPHNDGTGDDLPVLTEVIFDLGEPVAPALAAARPASAPTPPQQRPVAPGTRPPAPAAPPPRAAPAATPRAAPAPTPQAGLPPRAPTPRTPPPAPSVPPTPPAPSAASVATVIPQSKPWSGLSTRLPSPHFQSPVPPPSRPKPPAPPATPPNTAQQARDITEELKLLDAQIVSEVETWLREELPALVVREIAKLNERLRTEAVAHLRATLLPRLSEHIAEQIDRLGSYKPGP